VRTKLAAQHWQPEAEVREPAEEQRAQRLQPAEPM
jgi:hypothetical protein